MGYFGHERRDTGTDCIRLWRVAVRHYGLSAHADAHPQTVNPGEFDFLFDYLSRDPAHPTGWRVDVAALSHDRIFRDKTLHLPAGDQALDGLDLIEFFLEQIRSNTPAATVITLNVHRNAARIVAAFPDARFIHMVRDPRDVARSSIRWGGRHMSIMASTTGLKPSGIGMRFRP